jgi:membrane protease YdiL (CAAX protease family)
MKNRKGVIAYLLIAFGMAWALWEIPLRLGVSMSNPLIQIAIMPGAFAPAVAAFIVRKWITREGFADAGLRLNLRKWRYYVVAWLLPLAVVGCIVVLAPLLGIGKADFSLVRGFQYLMSAGFPASAPRPLWMLTGGLLINAIIATPILFGEEFGWRGYLQLRLSPDRPEMSAVVTGLIWGAWHLPLNLRGNNFPDHPFVGGLLIFPVFTVFLSIIFAWLNLKTGSIWSSSLAHAATNAIGGSLTLLLWGGGPSLLFVSYAGLLGWIPLGAFSAWIVLTGRLKPANDGVLGRASTSAISSTSATAAGSAI